MPAPHRITDLHLAADPTAWKRAGFEVRDSTVAAGSVLIRIDPSHDPSPAGGVSAWSPGGPIEGDSDFDGLPVLPPGPEAPELEPGDGIHPNGVIQIDHVVVFTPDLDRTTAAFEDRGVRCRRLRETGSEERPLRQAFFRFSEVIVEVVEVPEDKAGPDGAATFWGLTFTVSDLDRAAAALGEDLGSPRDAVQPGRRIATVRPEAGLGVPVALITPAPERPAGS